MDAKVDAASRRVPWLFNEKLNAAGRRVYLSRFRRLLSINI
jgi:hypothetical protein